jgi:hypothetical protein
MLKTVSSITNAIGAINYKGTWNASTNTPTLASGVGTKGDYYVVSVEGSTTLDGLSNWGVGDWAVFNGSVWQRVEGGADGNFVNMTASGTATVGTLQTSDTARNVSINGQTISTSGSDANVDLNFDTQGTGSYNFQILGQHSIGGSNSIGNLETRGGQKNTIQGPASSGANFFFSIFGDVPQGGWVWVHEIGTNNFLFASLYKQNTAGVVIAQVLQSNVLTIAATNAGGTIAIGGAGVGANLRFYGIAYELPNV